MQHITPYHTDSLMTKHKLTRIWLCRLFLPMVCIFFMLSSCHTDDAPVILAEGAQVMPKSIADMRIQTMQAQYIPLEHLYRTKPVLLAVYLGAGCPMCVMTLQLLSQHAERIRGYGWEIAALSNDTPEDNALALERPKGDSSFTQPGGEFSIALYSDTNHRVMEALRCYRRNTDTERHGLFLIDIKGHILFDTIDRRPVDNLEPIIERIRRSVVHPSVH